MELGSSKKLAIQRLTALWALTESGLGGLLHAFNSPFTGLFVGSIAIILIALIYTLSGKQWSVVLKALTIVLIIKMAVAPHSNITSYFAVSFQAVAGIIILRIIPSIAVGSIVFAVVALVESAIQKILVLYILYGKTIWEAIDEFGVWVNRKFENSFLLITSKNVILVYIGLYIMMGLLVGLFIAAANKSIKKEWNNPKYMIQLDKGLSVGEHDMQRKKSNYTHLIFIMITLLILTLFASLTQGIGQGFYLLGRTMLLLGIWYLFLAPWIMKQLRKLLKKRQSKLGVELDQTFILLPYLKTIITRAWSESRDLGTFKKWYYFLIYTILYSLRFKLKQ
ncbi:MAG: hypothetical protein HKN09_03885 [Saprospiraceae bacterium]|nr:hypothetical protein [Saprospiraceae bacterium]